MGYMLLSKGRGGGREWVVKLVEGPALSRARGEVYRRESDSVTTCTDQHAWSGYSWLFSGGEELAAFANHTVSLTGKKLAWRIEFDRMRVPGAVQQLLVVLVRSIGVVFSVGKYRVRVLVLPN